MAGVRHPRHKESPLDPVKMPRILYLIQSKSAIMDNLSSHKSKNVEEAINARGAKLIFSPPYSPELSPIEYYWAKMKKYLKKKCAKTRDELDNAIKEACEFIDHSDISGWFRHCGYCI
ncbi:transposase [Candidatus Magnetobacterium bavaricum]|uniref:Transposase n=2 Tax=Candidatus Magnetobacterium bavaricum TaxID=29290 RepID=A0A0F3GK23_9BACT|nr:transposase [Candidatus Magnetobacterium bavaricum]